LGNPRLPKRSELYCGSPGGQGEPSQEGGLHLSATVPPCVVPSRDSHVRASRKRPSPTSCHCNVEPYATRACASSMVARSALGETALKRVRRRVRRCGSRRHPKWLGHVVVVRGSLWGDCEVGPFVQEKHSHRVPVQRILLYAMPRLRVRYRRLTIAKAWDPLKPLGRTCAPHDFK
jgi:hypothetical protein